MPCIYTHRDFELALDALWSFLTEQVKEDARLILLHKHPVLAELDECGPGGIMGIGLGNPGAHALGLEKEPDDAL
jgi:hypothetical protein